MEVWKDGEKRDVERKSLWVTDRSRSEVFKKCPRKGFYTYYWDGTGVQSSFPAEDPEMGHACHEALEGLLKGRLTVNQAGFLAQGKVMEGKGKVVLQQDPLLWRIAPEAAEMLLLEQAYLCRILVEAWGRRRMEGFARQYELLGVEEEINWEMADGVVCMSRVDGTLKDFRGNLYALSFKTAKQLETDDIEALKIQPQNWTECLAIQHKQGKGVSGVVYHELIKGKKYRSKAKDAPPWKRYTTGLIRPYYNQQAGMGGVRPEYFSFDRKASRGWEQINIWELMDVGEWIDWLDEGLILTDEGENPLDKTTAEPEVVRFDEDRAKEWLNAQLVQENHIALSRQLVEENPGALGNCFIKHEHACFYYGYRCTFYDVCHGLKTIEDGLAAGQYQTRVPNHIQEQEDIEEDGILHLSPA